MSRHGNWLVAVLHDPKVDSGLARPVRGRGTLTMPASTMAYSMSGSSDTASNSRFQISAFTQSRTRVKNCSSARTRPADRQGLPVRAIHSTASTNSLSSLPRRLGSPLHLRPLGVSQNELVHPQLESQPIPDENPEFQQTLVHSLLWLPNKIS
jgi:hypothetical protein